MMKKELNKEMNISLNLTFDKNQANNWISTTKTISISTRGTNYHFKLHLFAMIKQIE